MSFFYPSAPRADPLEYRTGRAEWQRSQADYLERGRLHLQNLSILLAQKDMGFFFKSIGEAKLDRFLNQEQFDFVDLDGEEPGT